MTGEFQVDPSWYWSRERAEQEWEHVWTRVWHMGPREEEIAEEDDVMIHTLGRESLLFVRLADGSVRGYFNVCRHRGNRLMLGADGPAYAPRFTCAFHGWAFGLDGGLEHVPYRERFDPAVIDDPACTSLRTFRVESFAGWLWFTLDDAAPGLREYLGPMADKLDAYRMERAQIVDYKTFEFACNWKTTLDAFNESYHFQTLHSEILAWGNEDAPITLVGIHSYMVNEYGRPSPSYPEHDKLNPALEMLLTVNGIDPAEFAGRADDVRRAVQDAKRAKQGEGVFPYDTLSNSQLSDAYHYMLFPTTHLNLFPEFYVAMRYRPHPDGDPERMYFDFIMCAPLAEGETVPPYEHRVVRGGEESIEDVLKWGARQHPVVNEVLGQDVDLVEHVQKGLRSQSFTAPILSSDERRIGHFNQTIDALIRGRSIRDLIAESPVETDAIPGD
ncbi:aromatic ring-hydroxylating dioxygenase subunit alpha [Croceicoccus sp. BE223]|uniref:aromatic ring-hydroxylating oxygenase subunit alpha n=1 Tax=Croceicoccus sp. BE223 TaxID=2817716 RepID=UPI0028615B6A|nr:aromatic ring-hydroxylating dioxygenase subunit alpha [Croceicoccus sp. BE223]MDR7102410.1 phenylpropionate dioxygenase-like ring-hydroxylating dioxygenase large terminal subunit [Croceicoccus sp. BE223]